MTNSQAVIEESHKLEADLGMNSFVRRAMYRPYSLISCEYGGTPVLQKEAESAEIVKEAIDLVYKHANAPTGNRGTK